MQNIFMPRNSTNSISKAIRVRDELFSIFQQVIANDEYASKVILRRSQPYDATTWISAHYIGNECDDEQISMPCHVIIEVNRHDFHQFENTFTITVTKGDKTKIYDNIYQLNSDELKLIHEHAKSVYSKYKPSYFMRNHWFQIWRPRNKNIRIKANFVLLIAFLISAVFFYFIPVLIILWILEIRKPVYILTTGKPLFEPRRLQWLDSWQVNLLNMGDQVDELRKAIFQKLDTHQNMSVEVETVGHWGVDNWIERNQIVVQHRRAMGFVSIEKYDNDLYISWEVHLNNATWAEETISKGTDKISGKKVQVNQVKFGWQDLTEFDVSDANFLSEYIHENIKKIIKLKMVECQIDQEIDFSVTRESRRNTLDRSEEQGKKFKRKS